MEGKRDQPVETSDGGLERACLGWSSSKILPFTFVPVVQTLPVQTQRTGPLVRVSTENPAAPEEKKGRTSEEGAMSDGGVFRAEVVYIKDTEEGRAAEGGRQETRTRCKPPADHMTLPQPPLPPIRAQAGHTALPRFVSGPAAMETAVIDSNKPGGVSRQPSPPTPPPPPSEDGVRRGLCLNASRPTPPDSPAPSPTPASSRESVLSDDWDRDPYSSASLSRTVSPCSSVRSGVFSPEVVRVRRHSLAPGSSLLLMAPSGDPDGPSSSCSSPCPLSPRARHRPPPTRLSLLTAILRKGRLPVLSSSLQRPYSPCWPINTLSLATCKACSAASSLASIPLELGRCRGNGCGAEPPGRAAAAPRTPVSPAPPYGHWESDGKATSDRVVSSPSPPARESTPLPPSSPLPPPPLPATFRPRPSSPPNLREPRDQRPPPPSSPPPSSLLYPASPPGLRSPSPRTFMAQISRPAPSSPATRLRPPSPEPAKRQAAEPRPLPSSFPDPPPCSSPSPVPSGCPSPAPPRFCYSPTVTPSSQWRSMGSTPPPSLPNGVPDRRQPRPGDPPARSLLPYCLSPSRYTPLSFPGSPSPEPSLCPSPAPPYHALTLSPSLSRRSTPSPRPGSALSDCSDMEGIKRKPHKIKLSYKALAAIPTNTLLLDQQAIDDQVEGDGASRDSLDRLDREDTHTEMCSPAQLRQQSEELYAVIDEVLEDPILMRQPSPALRQSRERLDRAAAKLYSSSPRSLGRETKYATYNLQSPERKPMEAQQTKPGVIRPGVIRPGAVCPRLTVEDDDVNDEEEYHRNPFRQYMEELSINNDNKLGSTTVGSDAGVDPSRTAGPAVGRGEWLVVGGGEEPLPVSALQITESDGSNPSPVPDRGLRQRAPVVCTPTKLQMEEAFETHI